MTALVKYSKLEAIGLWLTDPTAEKREVIVSFGEASLVLSDGRTDTALTHWSLPAIERRNYGSLPAIYAPSDDPDAETVEIDDTDMIEAIETVREALTRARPRRGSVRASIVATLVIGTAALALWWFPEKLVSHTVEILPPVKRQEIGEGLLHSMMRFTGADCDRPEGRRSLEALSQRLFPGEGMKIHVLREGLAEGQARLLPGPIAVVHQDLLEQHDIPEVLAGHLLAAAQTASEHDPLAQTLTWMGVRATFSLVSSGTMPDGALDPQAAGWLHPAQAPQDHTALLARFAQAKLTATPYAETLPEGALRTALLAGDPQKGAANRALIPDNNWLSIQSICQR